MRDPRSWKPAFLKNLATSANVSVACQRAGVSRSTAYRVRATDDEFAEAWEDAIDEAVDALEGEAHRRAVEGTLEPVYQGGKQVGEIRKYSDTLLIFLLKAHRPEKFREIDIGKLAEALERRYGFRLTPHGTTQPN
jgi:hypothetical protein